MSKSGKATRQNVRVICRVRPTNAREIREGGSTCVKCTEDHIDVSSDGGNNKFNFDRVFGMESTQVDVFKESAAPLIEDVLAGYNATIFAYGQTGTGKTHTMEGDITSEDGKGIIPRAVEALFQGVVEADENIEFTFRVSYVEIYLEKIRDLLDEHRTKTNLAIREDKLKGVYIAGVTEEYVTSVDELLQIMHVGAHNRATAATGMNEGSSRSHSVFTITVTQKDTRTNAQKAGKLVLVDLAGSEMVRKTGASGQQLEEAKMINKSLSALGQVIYALTDEKATHVPYRDSKLTRVLQDSLGGNSKTVLIVAVSPSSFNASETVSTLRFGMRAKSIENKVKINATRSVEELEALLVRAENAIDAQSTYILSLTTRIEALQGQLQQYQQHPPPVVQQSVVVPAATSSDETSSQKEVETVVREVVVMPPNAVILEEGKVVVDVSRLESEALAIQKLQEEVFRLQQDLDDERQDSQRKDGEIESLSRLLKDKDRLVQELNVNITDLTRSNETQQSRIELLLQEKISIAGELASVKANIAESTSKITYQLQEMEVTMSTLTAENDTLKKEIAELSGEKQQEDTTPTNAKSSSKGAPHHHHHVISSDGILDSGDDQSSLVSSASSRATQVSSQSTQPIYNNNNNNNNNPNNNAANNNNNRRLSSNYNPMGGDSNSPLLPPLPPNAHNNNFNNNNSNQNMRVNMDRKALLEQMADQFATLCLKHGVDDLISADLFAVMDTYAMEAEKSFQLTEDKFQALEKMHHKKIKDLDEQRLRLQMDLQSRIENMIALQMRLDAVTRHPPMSNHPEQAKEMMALLERDKLKQKSLQQRLEQLVAVHRQLLRKFATLELENVELKKKTILREERIKQLEDNSRANVNNVRLQAEKHLAEVAIFREQIAMMKVEFEKQYEAARLAEENANGAVSGANGNVSGGGAGTGMFASLSGRSPGANSFVSRATLMNRNVQPKSIRGGGVGGKSFYLDSSNSNANNTNNNNNGDIGSGNNYNSLAATLSPSAMLSRYQSFSFGHFNQQNNTNNNNVNNTNNAPATPPVATPPPSQQQPQSTSQQAPSQQSGGLAAVMEEPRSMGLAARLLGNK